MKLTELLAFEESLKPGDVVTARWTNCGSYYSAQAKIKRINAKSVRVTLTERIDTGYGCYPEGWEIVVPRVTQILSRHARHSVNNGVYPAQAAAA